MSLRSNGDIKRRTRNSTVKFNTAKDRLRDASLAVFEQLEARQLLNAVLVQPEPNFGPQSTALAPRPGHTFYVNGQGGSQWNQASAITPYTTNDLVMNVTPFDTNYGACCEGAGGSLGINLMTNGIIQNQTGAAPNPQSPAVGSGASHVSDPSNNINVLSDLSGPWYSSYHLGTAGGATANSTGYDLSEIDIISGHQDYRTQMTDDVLVQYVGSTDWVSLSNGGNFTFARDTNGNGLNKGSAQLAIVSGHPGQPIATNVQNVKFLAASDITWFREFVVTGTASSQTGLPNAAPAHITNASFNTNTQFVDLSFQNTATSASNNPFYYQIQRAVTPNGPWTTIGAVPQTDPGTSTNFTDTAPQPSKTYYYRVEAWAPGSQFVASDNVGGPVQTPALAVEAHYYNQAYWEGPVSVSSGLLSINANFGGSPLPGIIRGNSNSAVFTGKVLAPSSGVYTFVSNTDDDGFLYVNGSLVSEDPGGHGQRDAAQSVDTNQNPIGSVFPISLVGGQQYDYVFLYTNQGGGSGAHMEWITPTMKNSNQTKPVAVPFQMINASNQTIQILTPVSDTPTAPTGLTIVGTPSSNDVNFTFTANNNAVVNYILQRSADNGNTWTTVNQIEPGSNGFTKDFGTGNNDMPGTSVTMQIQDGSVIGGQSYQYRVAAVNYDGVVPSPTALVNISAVPDLANPTAPATTSLTADASGLQPGTYFVQYTWTNSANQETAASPEQAVPVAAASDIKVTIPAGAGVTGGKVYVSNATGQELLFGSAAAGGVVTINALPAPSAAAAPTSSGTGLPAGTYWVEYSWVGNNSTGETAAGGENVIMLTGNQDLSISIPTAPAGASSANVYVGSTSGSETFVGTAGSGATIVLNRLPSGGVAAPTWDGTFNPSATVTSPVIVNNASSIANTSSNPGGVEARYYNQQLIDYNRVGGSTTNDKFNVALNGIVTEYTKLSTNAFAGQDSLGGTWMYAGAIDFNWSSQPTSFTGVNGSTNSPDPRNYPDIERVHNTDQTSLFTGQIVANQTGVYTIITNTDDDGFLWIDDKLVSADPNGHGQQDANNTRTYGNNVNDSLIPVSLIAGSHYNFVFLQQEGGGGSGAHLKWIQPQVTNGTVQAANNCTNQNGATINLDPNSSSGTNGAYNGFTIYITGGTGNGEKGVITGYNGTSHQAIVNVTGGGNSLLWGTVPNTTSTYKIAWEQGIPLLGAGTSSGLHNGNGEGLMQYMSVPHNEVYNINTGQVTDFNPVINLNDTANSAASGVTITNIDPNKGVSLKWTDKSASELWFEVQRSNDNGTTWTTIGKTPMIIGTTFTDQQAGNAFNSSTISYSYRVRGVNFDGVGPWSNVAATNSLPTPGSPTINAVVQGDAGTIGLTFGNNVLLGGGIELQEQDVTTGGTFQDVTRNPLPANTFDYLVTGLNPAHTYAFQVRSVQTPNLPPSAFSTPVTVVPAGATPENIGSPNGMGAAAYTNGAAITGQFAGMGDLKLNNGANITAAYPAAPIPSAGPALTTQSDVQNPSAQPTTSLVASPGTPVDLATNSVSFTQDSNAGLIPGTYYLRYTWVGSNGGETVGDHETIINTQNGSFTPVSGGTAVALPGESSPGQFGDVTVTIPTAPTNAASANVYISNVAGHEQLIGNAKGGATLKISGRFNAPRFDAITSSSATVPTSDTTGLPAGTYWIQYTWTGGNGETTPTAATPVFINAGTVADINVTIPGLTTTQQNPAPNAANIYIGTTATSTFLAGSAGAAKSLLIKNLPSTAAAHPPTVNNIGMQPGTYFVEYAWIGNYPNDNLEGQPGPATEVSLTSLGDINVTLPNAPSGATNANVYVGTTSSSLNLVGSVGGGKSLTIRNPSTQRGPNPLNPTAALTAGNVTQQPGIGNPDGSVPLNVLQVADSNGVPAGTYYVEYTYQTAAGETTAGQTETPLTVTAPADLYVSVSTAPAGVSGVNIYLGTTTGGEHRWGSYTIGNSPSVIVAVPPTTAATPPTVSQTGLADGTYYLKYTWTGGGGYTSETAASPEFKYVVANGANASTDLVVTAPTGVGTTNTNVFISSKPGQEVQVGSMGNGKSLTISTVPDPVTGRLAPAATWAQGFFTPANALQIAPNANGTASSAFNPGENIAGFNTSFDFMFTGSEAADGFAFVIQPDSQSAVGGGGGSLGYDGIGHSVAVYFAMYGNSNVGFGVNGSRMGGTAVENNGLQWSLFDNNQAESDVYNATIGYDNTAKVLTLTVTDETKAAVGINASYTTSLNIDIPKTIGMNNAFVGFTGANGGAHSEKDILNWSFTHASTSTGVQSNVITLPSGTNSLNITTDGTNALWTLGGVNYGDALNDPAGLTINGNGAADSISFSGNSALPNSLKLNTNTGGNFTLNGLSGSFLTGKSLNIAKNTVFISYAAGQDPIANVFQYLKAGNTAAWAPGTSSAVTSTDANADSKHATGIGYADSADAGSPDTVANTIELKDTLYGDANLDGTVNFSDFSIVAANYNKTGKSWDNGDFNYDNTVNFSDFSLLAANYNKTMS